MCWRACEHQNTKEYGADELAGIGRVRHTSSMVRPSWLVLASLSGAAAAQGAKGDAPGRALAALGAPPELLFESGVPAPPPSPAQFGTPPVRNLHRVLHRKTDIIAKPSASASHQHSISRAYHCTMLTVMEIQQGSWNRRAAASVSIPGNHTKARAR